MYYTAILLCTCLLGTSLVFDGPLACWENTPPNVVKKGHPTKLQWRGGDGSPVTIVLGKQPQGQFFHAVSTIARNVPDKKFFDWTPSKSLAAGPGYVLMLTQGVNNCGSLNFTISDATTNSAKVVTITVTSPGSTITSTRTASGAIDSENSSTPASTSTTPKPTSSSLSQSAKGGIAGGILGVVIMGLVIFMFGRYRRRIHLRRHQGITEKQGLYSQHAEAGVVSNEAEAVKEKRESLDSKSELHGDHVPHYSRELEGSPGIPDGQWVELP